MPKRVTLIGWPGSGKTLFTIGIAHVLSNLDKGYLEPRHPDYGMVMASALAGKSVKVSPTTSDYISLIQLHSGLKIEIVEKSISLQEFQYSSRAIENAICDSQGVLFFIRPELKGGSGRKNRNVVSGRPAVAKQARSFGSAIEQIFRPLKFRRKIKFIMFIMTRTNPKEFRPQYLEKCVASEIGNSLAYAKKRGARCSYHPLELIYPTKGINLMGLTYAVRILLENLK